MPRTPKDGGKPPKDAGKKDTEKRPATGVVLPLNRERDHKGRLRNPHPDQLCGANLTSGNGTCKNRAGQFTEHPGFGRCGYHGGNTKPHRTKAARDEANEAAALMGMGMDNAPEVSPEAALLAEVYRTAAIVAWMERIVNGWNYSNPRELLLQLDPDHGYEKAAWFKVFTEQRMHLARVSKMALDAGVAERLVSLAEAQADLFNTAITNIVTDLGMDPADGNVRSIVAHRLSEMAALAAG